MLEGSRRFPLSGGGGIEPSLSLGLRHDGGDAETGTGVETGAGLTWSEPSRGLTSELRVRGLASHGSGGYEEWGASGSLRLAPDPSGRGASLSVTPSWGAGGQAGRVWDAGPGAADGGGDAGARLDAELGYGLPALGGRLTGTPHAGFGLSDTACEYRLGWRFGLAGGGAGTLDLELGATRKEPANDDGEIDHTVGFKLRASW